MVIDDKTVFNLILELMEIRKEPENILQTQQWINEVGLKKVFDLVLNMHTEIKEDPVEYPYAETNETQNVENTDKQ